MTTTLKNVIKEEIRTALWESKDVKRAVLESRLALVTEKLTINEADWVNRATNWIKNKAFGAETNAKNFVGNNVLVNPENVINDPMKAMKVVQKSLAGAKAGVAAFKQDALRSSQVINSLEDKVFDAFGKFFNLIDSLPPEKRGLLEREVMQVVGMFYSALDEEKKRIEVYLSALAREVGSQGYNLGNSAKSMASWAPVATPKVVGSRVVEPETDLIGARA